MVGPDFSRRHACYESVGFYDDCVLNTTNIIQVQVPPTGNARCKLGGTRIKIAFWSRRRLRAKLGSGSCLLLTKMRLKIFHF